MIRRYRLEHCEIIASQFSILNSLQLVLNLVKLNGLSFTHAINAVCVSSLDHLVNCLNMRKYLKMLFDPTEAFHILSDSTFSNEEETCE